MELISSKTKEFVSRIQQLKNCEYVCLYKNGETIPEGERFIDIGEVVTVENSVAIAEALEQAARSGLERTWKNDQFETVGYDELTNIVF